MWKEQEMHSSSKSDLALLHICCFRDKFSPALALLQNKGIKDDSLKGFQAYMCVCVCVCVCVCGVFVWIALIFRQNTSCERLLLKRI